MDRKSLRWQRLAPVFGVAVSCALLVGCQDARSRPGPITANRPASGAPAPEADWPLGLSLFGDRPELEAVPFENRLVTNITRHTFTADGLDFDPDVFERGNESLLAFASTRNSNRPDIFVKQSDGTTITELTSDPADDIQPRFSPDGGQLVFSSNRTGNWDIWLIRRDGTGLTQLTTDSADEVSPCWSPDGRQVAYAVWGPRSRQWELWVLSLERPGLRHFLTYGLSPAWSPDGKHLAFQRARQRGSRAFSIWTVELVGAEARQPTEIAHDESAACIAPRWSPDGRFLVYCAVSGEAPTADRSSGVSPAIADLWAVDAGTGLRLKLTDGSTPAFNPAWAAGGRVFFVTTRSGTENVWSLATELGPDDGGPVAAAEAGSREP